MERDLQMRILVPSVLLLTLACLCAGAPAGLTFHSSFDGDYETEIGPAPVDVVGSVEYINALSGQGILLEGESYLRYRATDTFSKAAGTVTFWMRPQWSGDDGRRYGLFSDSAPTHDPAYNALYLLKTPASTLQLDIRGEEDHTLRTSIATWQAGQWHHVSIAWDANQGATLYVDGTLASRKSFAFEPRQWPYFNIGSDFDGAITARSAFADVRIFDRMLRPDQVAAVADQEPLEAAGLIEMTCPDSIKTGTTFDISLRALAAEQISMEHNVLISVGDTPIASVPPQPPAPTWGVGQPVELEPMTVRVPSYMQIDGGKHQLSAVLEGTMTSATVPRARADVHLDAPYREPQDRGFELRDGIVYHHGEPWLPDAADSGFVYANEFFAGTEEGQQMARRLYERGGIRDALRCRIVGRAEGVASGDPEQGWSIRNEPGTQVRGPVANLLVVTLDSAPDETIGVQVRAVGEESLTDHMLLWGAIPPGDWRSQDYRVGFVFYPKTVECTVRLTYLQSGDPAHRNVKSLSVYELIDYPMDNYVSLPPGTDHRTVTLFPGHTRQIYTTFGHGVGTCMQRDYSVRQAMHYARFLGVDRLNFYAAGAGGPYYDEGMLPNVWRWDVLDDIPGLAGRAGVDVVPVLPSLSNFEDLYTFSEASFQIGADGETVTDARGHRCPDPLRPEVQQQLLSFLDEISAQLKDHGNVPAIGMTADGRSGTCYCSQGSDRTAARAGYSAFDLLNFQTKARMVVAPGTDDPAAAYEWLRADEDRWRRWMDFRCAHTADLWIKCRDMIVSRDTDRNLLVDARLPVPANHEEYSLQELFRTHGYDPALLRGEHGAVIAGTMQHGMDPDAVSFFRTEEGLAVQFDCSALPGGREFFAPILKVIMAANPGNITFRNSLDARAGRELLLREFIRSFRALPDVEATEFECEIWPMNEDIWVRRFGDTLAVINPTAEPQEVRITFEDQLPLNTHVIDKGTGQKARMLRGKKISRIIVQTEPYDLKTLFINKPVVEPGVRYDSGRRPSPLETE